MHRQTPISCILLNNFLLRGAFSRTGCPRSSSEMLLDQTFPQERTDYHSLCASLNVKPTVNRLHGNWIPGLLSPVFFPLPISFFSSPGAGLPPVRLLSLPLRLSRCTGCSWLWESSLPLLQQRVKNLLRSGIR